MWSSIPLSEGPNLWIVMKIHAGLGPRSCLLIYSTMNSRYTINIHKSHSYPVYDDVNYVYTYIYIYIYVHIYIYIHTYTSKQISNGARPGLESLPGSEGKSQNRSRTRSGESLEAGDVERKLALKVIQSSGVGQCPNSSGFWTSK